MLGSNLLDAKPCDVKAYNVLNCNKAFWTTHFSFSTVSLKFNVSSSCDDTSSFIWFPVIAGKYQMGPDKALEDLDTSNVPQTAVFPSSFMSYSRQNTNYWLCMHIKKIEGTGKHNILIRIESSQTKKGKECKWAETRPAPFLHSFPCYKNILKMYFEFC